MSYFFCKSNDFWQDSWTYGDWRQYMCRRKDGALQCAKMSSIPFFVALIGFCIMVLCATAIIVNYAGGVPLYWPRVGFMWVLGSLMIVPIIMQRNYNVYLMTSVGPKQYDGKRILPGEEKD